MARCSHTFPSHNYASSTRHLHLCQSYNLCFLPTHVFSLLKYDLPPGPKGNKNGLTLLCKAFRKDSFRMGWHLTECHPNFSDHWLENFNQEIPANESINNQTLAEVLCAPPVFIFICSGWHFHGHMNV